MLSRSRVCWFTLLGATACGAGQPTTQAPASSTVPPTTASPAPSATASAEPTAPPPRAEPALGRTYLGEGPPTITVHNAYPLPQHLFLDGQPLGTVQRGQRASFEVAPGVHTLTCANSADQGDLPSSLTETFEAGYQYRYDIQAR